MSLASTSLDFELRVISGRVHTGPEVDSLHEVQVPILNRTILQ
jgi:hypothetical protein